jgi:hypothetical protein
MADTYGDMLDTIADESRRPRATFGTQIARCVQEAIDEYARVRFPWNVIRSNTFSTVAAQEYYTSSDAAWIDDILEFDAVTITIAANDLRTLCQDSWEDLEELNADAASTGQPDRYSYWGETLRLYPVPSAVYTVRVAGLFALTRLSADADTNAWVVRGKGEKIIRCRASAIFYGTYLRQPDRAGPFQNEADAEFSRLTASKSRREASGRIRPSL